MGAFQIEDTVYFVYLVYPLLIAAMTLLAIKEFRKSLPEICKRDWAALSLVMAFALLWLVLHSDIASQYWGPSFQNWKFEYNALSLSRFEPASFEIIHHNGAAFLMIPFLWIFGVSHSSVVMLNAIAFVVCVSGCALAARELAGRRSALILTGFFACTYDPLLALWPAGGEYMLCMAACSLSIWLILRDLRVGSLGGFFLTALSIQYASMIRMEALLLWGIWFIAYLTMDERRAGRLKVMVLLGSVSFIISSMAFDNFFSPREALEDKNLHYYFNGYLYYLAEALPILLAALFALFAFLKKGDARVLALLCGVVVFSVMLLFSASSDVYQLSNYLFIPLAIIAGSFTDSLSNRPKILAVLSVLLVASGAFWGQSCIWSNIELFRQPDKDIRELAGSLENKGTPLLIYEPYAALALCERPLVQHGIIPLKKLVRNLDDLDSFACFALKESQGGCDFVELFSDVRELVTEGLTHVDPEKYGFKASDIRENGAVVMRVYHRSAGTKAGRLP